MDILQARQVPYHEALSKDFDMIIAVSGYESRSSFLVRQFDPGNASKQVIGFSDKTEILFRPSNDKVFEELGYRFFLWDGGTALDAFLLFQGLDKIKTGEANILIDYSSMTKTWYASIINHFLMENPGIQKVNLYFSYTPSEYARPKKARPFKIAEPLGFRSKRLLPGKPVALIMGLGYEKDRAVFVQKAVSPDTTYLFYSEPAFDRRFVEKVYINNFRLIDNLQKNQVIAYPVRELDKIDYLLTTLCLELRMHHKVIIAPMGPKPFALCSLLLSARYPDIEVWRVSAGPSECVYDRKPGGDPIVCRAIFVYDDEACWGRK